MIIKIKHIILTIYLILFALQSSGQTTFSGGNISGGKIGSNSKDKITTKVDILNANPQIVETQRLLNLYGYMDAFSGIWDKTSRDALKNLYKRELKINHNGNWSVEVLQDLKKRQLITIPLQGPSSFAEEIVNIGQLDFWDKSKMKTGKYRAGDFGFTAVESSEISLPFCYPTKADCKEPRLITPQAHNGITADFNGDGLEDLAIVWVFVNHTVPREKTPSHIRFYLNNGQGELISTPSIYADDVMPLRHMIYRTVSEDFNGDGVADLFAGTMGVGWKQKNSNLSLNHLEPQVLLLSDGNGKLKDASNTLPGQEFGGRPSDFFFAHTTTSGDLNCDGNADIYSGGIYYAGNGLGSFEDKTHILPKPFQPANRQISSVIADINGDSCGDLVMSDFNGVIWVWMSENGNNKKRKFFKANIDHNFGLKNMLANYAVAGDLDKDGKEEVVFNIHPVKPYYMGRKLVIMKFDGRKFKDVSKGLIEDDRHTETSKFDKAHGEGSIRILDHDNDGDLDIIDSPDFNWNGKKPRFTYKIFENDGTGKFNSIPQSEMLVVTEDWLKGERIAKRGLGMTFPINLDGEGIYDYVSFIHSPYNPKKNVLYGFTVLGK